jgi:hypothetical protein
MDAMITFVFQLLVISTLINILRVMYNNAKLDPVPKRLVKIKEGIEKGKPHRRYWHILRANPMFDEHYRYVPGRLTCAVLPYKCNKEDIWQLRVGFKTTADEKEPSSYINIPVYKNGKIYDV